MDENINALEMAEDETNAKKPLWKKQGVIIAAGALALVAVIAVYALGNCR